MLYRCLRCGEPGELRRGKSPKSNYAKYRGVEEEMKNSNILHLHKAWGNRNLCPTCLKELSAWLREKAQSLAAYTASRSRTRS